MRKSDHADGIRQRFQTLASSLDERQLRLWAASEAKAVGYGGVSLVARVSGLARSTIHAGLTELDQATTTNRIRKLGAGRKRLTETPPELLAALDRLVEPASRGDPVWGLRFASERRFCECRCRS